MSTQPAELQFVRCLKCLKILTCSRYNTSCLVNHIRQDHPEILEGNDSEKVAKLHRLAAAHGISEERISQISKMTGMSEDEMADKAERYLQKKQTHSSSQKAEGGENTIKLKPKKIKKPRAFDSTEKNRRQYYRSSIERWIPIEGCIYCPCCGCKQRPLIRTSAEFYANTDCATCCVLGFWPFCFLPCFSPSDNREYLHCSNCETFLAVYDRDRNCIRPNGEFL